MAERDAMSEMPPTQSPGHLVIPWPDVWESFVQAPELRPSHP